MIAGMAIALENTFMESLAFMLMVLYLFCYVQIQTTPHNNYTIFVISNNDKSEAINNS